MRLRIAAAVLVGVSLGTIAQAQQVEFRVPLAKASVSTAVDANYSWVASQTACSNSCGVGTFTTSYSCVNNSEMGSGSMGASAAPALCTASVGAAPASGTQSCEDLSGCGFTWVKPPEVVSPSAGRPGCGVVTRIFSPYCKRSDGTVLAQADHQFCRHDMPNYADVAAGVPGALGYNKTNVVETSACTPSDYQWSVGPWSPPTSTCDQNATESRVIQCLRGFDHAVVADSFCTGEKPATVQATPTFSSCTYSASFGPWSSWSSGCDSGATRTRSVQCIRSNNGGTVVDDSECAAHGVSETPVSDQGAQYGSCSYAAINPGAWSGWASGCSASTTQTRHYQCQRSNNGGQIVADSECTSRGISVTESRSGSNYASCSYSFQAGAWSAWSSGCSASATQTRSVSCKRSDGTTVSDSECTSRGVSMPSTTNTGANYSGCGYSAVNWSGFSACSNGSQTKTAQCQRSDGAMVSTSECSSRGIAVTQTQGCADAPSCNAGTFNITYNGDANDDCFTYCRNRNCNGYVPLSTDLYSQTMWCSCS